jgi:flagellar motor switch protein FliN/FliY
MRENLQWLAAEWTGALESAAGMTTGREAKAWAAEAAPPDTALRWEIAASGEEAARIAVEAPAAAVRALGESLLASAGLEGGTGQEVKGAFLEVLQQSLAPLSQAIGARAGREVQFTAGRETAALPPDCVWVGAVLALDGEELPPLRLACTPALLGLISGRAQARAEAPRLPAKEIPMESAAQPGGQGSRTFELLLEVEMPVSVSFGRAQIRLKDAIKLTTGSIVELNRSVTEPVELIVNNCVVARGEVVVVEGNYGVRIREIISREERLRTLF